MSISRTAYLSLAALLAIAPAACGGDDDGDDGGGAADSGGGGGQADAGGGEADAGGGEADAGGGEADAAPVDGAQYLLGIGITVPLPLEFRFIATVDLGKSSGDFSLQPIVSADCDAEEAGNPVGDAESAIGVPIEKDGSFEINLPGGTIPTTANPLNCMDLTGDFVVTGAIQKDLTACGEVAVTAPIMASGTFGTVAIEPGTIGDDNLPAPVFACEE